MFTKKTVNVKERSRYKKDHHFNKKGNKKKLEILIVSESQKGKNEKQNHQNILLEETRQLVDRNGVNVI